MQYNLSRLSTNKNTNTPRDENADDRPRCSLDKLKRLKEKN